jgi:hypothetical protein
MACFFKLSRCFAFSFLFFLIALVVWILGEGFSFEVVKKNLSHDYRLISAGYYPRPSDVIMKVFVANLGLVLVSAPFAFHVQGFDYDARHSSTKSNLSSSRSSLNLYRSRNSTFPVPTVSGGYRSTNSGEKTLEAILTNSGGHGDGTEYVRGNIAGELIFSPGGNNYVCVVDKINDFWADQSDGQGCINPSTEETFVRGGYVYCLTSGDLRLNFPVNGSDLREGRQFPISKIVSEKWDMWMIEKDCGLEEDWPAQW